MIFKRLFCCILTGAFAALATTGTEGTLIFRDGFENNLPIITSSPVTIGDVDELYTYDVEADDPDADVLAFTLLVAPEGMSIDEINGEIAWTPDEPGFIPVEIQVSDGNGGTAIQAWEIHIVSPVNCPGLVLETSSSLPLQVVDAGSLPAEFEPPLALQVTWAGGPEVALSYVEMADEGSAIMIAPFHPSGSLDGGEVELRIKDELIACPAQAFQVEPLPAAPGEFQSIVDLMQQLIGVRAGIIGITVDYLQQTDILQIPDHQLPLAVLQTIVDHPDNENSLRAILEGTAPFAQDKGDYLSGLDRVLALIGLRTELQAIVDNAQPVARLTEASVLGSAGVSDCLTQTIELPSVLNDCMDLAHSAQFRLDGMSNKVLNDAGLAFAITGLVPIPPVQLISAVTGLTLWAIQKFEQGTANLLPSMFQALSVEAAPLSFLEDQEGPGDWAAEVTAKSKGWVLDQLILEALLQFTMASDALGGWMNRFMDPKFIDGLGSFFLNMAVQKRIDNSAGSGFVEIEPEVFGPVDISDEEWTQQTILAGDSVELTGHNEYQPRRPGESLMDIRTIPGKFGGEQANTDPNISLEVRQILMNFLQDGTVVTEVAVADPSEVIPLKLRIRNSKYPQHVAVYMPDQLAGSANLSFDGPIEDGGIVSVNYTAPADLGQLPDFLTIDHLAETGARQGSTESRRAVVVFKPGLVTISPRPECIAASGETDFQANVTPEGAAVNWSIVGGGGSLNTLTGTTVTYSAPGSDATVTLRAELVSNSKVFDEVTFAVGDCLGMAVWYEHQASIGFPGNTGPLGECSNEDLDDLEESETMSQFVEPPTIPSVADLWKGDSSVIDFGMNDSGVRLFNRAEPGCDSASFAATASLVSSLQSNVAGDRLDVDIAADATSECSTVGANSDPVCSTASATTAWNAIYYIELTQAESFVFTMNLECTGPDINTFTNNIIVQVARFVDGTQPGPNNGDDPLDSILPIFADCFGGSPVNVMENWDLVGPQGNEMKDLITVIVTGSRSALAPLSDFPNPPALGNHAMNNSMQGFFSLEPKQ